MRLVVGLTLAFHALVLFLPLLFSRDVYSYSYYGRMVSTYHSNPYVMTPSDFRLNSLWGYTWPGWRATRPRSTARCSRGSPPLVTTWIHSVNALIKTFQVIAVAASLTHRLCRRQAGGPRVAAPSRVRRRGHRAATRS